MHEATSYETSTRLGAPNRHRAFDQAVEAGTAAVFEGLERQAVTRRRLLEIAAIAALTQLPLVANAPTAGVAQPGVAGDAFRRSTYQPLVGRRFAIRGQRGASIQAELVEVRDLRGSSGRDPGGEDAFALVFHGPRAPRLVQGMYELGRRGLARQRLLLTPSGTGRRGQDYEVVINQYRAGRG